MGKSTTANMFREEGVPVWDADATVHELYSVGGEAVDPIRKLVPSAVTSGSIDRSALSAALSRDQTLLSQLEKIVHPLVAADRERFVQNATSDIVVVDIPLLFEIGAENQVDYIAVVSTTPAIQRERVLARPGMTAEKFETLHSRQVPDAEKRNKADFIMDTTTLDAARSDLKRVIKAVREEIERCGKSS